MSEQCGETQRSKLADGFATLTWKNEPGSWGDGGHGSWSLSEDKQELEVVADSNRDYWQKTYYNPLLVKDDGPRFVMELPTTQEEWTMTVTPFTCLLLLPS
jgi:regulation of enolase protein 1 (concanavalin A-like superfamily)